MAATQIDRWFARTAIAAIILAQHFATFLFHPDALLLSHFTFTASTFLEAKFRHLPAILPIELSQSPTQPTKTPGCASSGILVCVPQVRRLKMFPSLVSSASSTTTRTTQLFVGPAPIGIGWFALPNLAPLPLRPMSPPFMGSRACYIANALQLIAAPTLHSGILWDVNVAATSVGNSLLLPW